MRHVPGSVSVDLLIGLGLTHDEVIAGLIREIGILQGEAECAWDYAAAKNATDEPHWLMASATSS